MWVKICGVRDESTAEQVCQLRPDAIGLNFYERSPRHVTRHVAARITKLSGDCVQRVGVFVNHSAGEIEDIVAECQLHAVQLHGDETATQVLDIIRRLPQVTVYRAWRMEGDSLSSLDSHLAECRSGGHVPMGCLIDARVAGSYGGTGHKVPWQALTREYHADWPPLILAGGLTPDNVAEAIRVVQPWGVDVASGVESAPGVKDLDAVRRFIENTRRA